MSELSDNLLFGIPEATEQPDDGITEDQLKEQLSPHINDLLNDDIEPQDAVETAVAFWNDNHPDYTPLSVDDLVNHGWFKENKEPA